MPTTKTTAASTTRAASGHRLPSPGAPAVFVASLAATLAVLLGASVASAQVCGDVSGDDKISVTDAQRVLKASVGQQVDLICTDQCAALETRLEAVEALLAHVTIDGNNLVLTGMNFQVVSGSGSTDGTVNGKGNIIIGYNETDDTSDKSTGSHNLIVGMDHSYTGYSGIVAGDDNENLANFSAVLGGSQNSVEEDGSVILAGHNNVTTGSDSVIVAGHNNEAKDADSVIVAGRDNETSAEDSVIVAGRDNLTDGESTAILAGEFNHTFTRSCSIQAGTLNACSGFASSIGGGSANVVSGDRSVISGTSNRTLGSALGWMAGSLTQF